VGSLEGAGAADIRRSRARSKKEALLLLLLFCGRSGKNIGLSGGDPPNPPLSWRARPYMGTWALPTKTSILLAATSLTGYEGPMEDLLDADPGLRSRFSTRLHLVDYSGAEVAEIAKLAASKKNFVFEEGLLEALGGHVEEAHGSRIRDENGRLAVNLVDRAIEALASRLVRSKMSKEDVRKNMSVLRKSDFGIGEEVKEGGGGSAGVDSEEARMRRRAEREGGKGGGGEGGPGLCGIVGSGSYSMHSSSTTSIGISFGNPLPGGEQRPQKVKTRPVDSDDGGRGARLRQAKAQTQSKKNVQVDTKSASKELKQLDVMGALAKVGLCPQSYEWQGGFYETATCGKCKGGVFNGYRCAGGTHYVCMSCINSA
jgi:hypothetical protein